MYIVSVVRDFEMYNRLVKYNQFYSTDAEFFVFNNNIENISIPKRYNSFLDSYDYSKEDWFVFCHEDWEIKEDLEQRLKNLDKSCLYGPIGVVHNWNGLSVYLYGSIKQSNKNGDNLIELGNYVDKLREVGTFDCQCLIVHSSLIKKHHLRFDENLSWDLYVEDFCVNARENYNIPSMILQLNCHHYSHGKIQDRFYQQYKYLQRKYLYAKNRYMTTCTDAVIGKDMKYFNFFKSVNKVLNKIFRFFYQNKKTKSGMRIIKICKIPVYCKLGVVKKK